MPTRQTSAPVTVVITCTLKPGLVDHARRELASVISTVMSDEPACRGIRVHADPQAPHRLLIIEQWDSVEAFTGPHMQTDHMKAFLKTAESFLDAPADFTFWNEILTAP